MDRGAWLATVQNIAKSQTQLTNTINLGLRTLLEKEMAAHSSILAWEIPWTEGPGWLLSLGLQTDGHD